MTTNWNAFPDHHAHAEHLNREIKRLADAILEIHGEPAQEGSAVDNAIAIMAKLRARDAVAAKAIQAAEAQAAKLEERITKLENGLRWIGQAAAIHAIGGAFDPEHMRDLANLSADILYDPELDLPNFEEEMQKASEEAQRVAKMFRDMAE